MAKLTKYEKETLILFNEGEDTASMYVDALSHKEKQILFELYEYFISREK